MLKSHQQKKTLPRPTFEDVPEVRRRNMAAIRGKNTKPELAVRRTLHAAGYRYRLHDKRLPGRPDLVFPSQKSAIEVRGCFFHRHGCANSLLPKTRRDWWEQKLAGNVARDAENEAALEAGGWRLLVVWECDVRDDLPAVVDQIRAFLGPPGAPGRASAC